MTESLLFAETALLPHGWARDVRFEIASDGSLAAVEAGASAEGAQRTAGPVVPGMPNLHSHAFQRAMAGLAERAGPQKDSFWTWRDVMYGFVGRLQPEEVQAIATQLYIEMLKAGYTAVGEFHYLHHDPQGARYSDPAEMSRRIVAAAAESGIGLTHLPVLYGYGGFGGQPAGSGQRRFLNDPDALLAIADAIRRDHASGQVRVGIAPHSLRAVTPDSLRAGLAGLDALDASAPIHLHIAEQVKEVDDCIAWCDRRPVEWLLDQFDVGERWCLVHATHMSVAETTALAKSGAVAGLCPTTEANLGDGIFPAPDYLAHDGLFGIGSDSHISISPIEELRWLEYGQRLVHRQRNVLAGTGSDASVGARLYKAALAGGARALGRPIGSLAEGCRADILVLNQDAPALLGLNHNLLLDGLVFAGNSNPVRDVMVGGQWRVRDGRHPAEDTALSAYQTVLNRLMS